jgi:hypothetical protein
MAFLRRGRSGMHFGCHLGARSERSGQVAQSVEQGIENPRVGGSIPSLATFGAVVALFAGGCKPDRCEALCTRTSNRLGECLQSYSASWEDLDADSKADFDTQCQNLWRQERAELEPRELEDALNQCDEAMDALFELNASGEVCDQLRAIYFP